MKAKLMIDILDFDNEVIAPIGTVFDWDLHSTHHRICGYLLWVEEHEVEFL